MPFTIKRIPDAPDTIEITTDPSAAFSSLAVLTPPGKTLRYVDVYTVSGGPVTVRYDAGTPNENSRVLNAFDRINPTTDSWGPIGAHDINTATLETASGVAEVYLSAWYL